MPALRQMTRFRSQRPGRPWVLFLSSLLFAGAWSCASEVIPNYGDPAQVAGGVGGAGGAVTTGSTTTVECEVDPDCAVSFKDDIFPILDRNGTQGCAVSDGAIIGCHSEGKGNLTLVAGDPASYFKGLTEYVLDSPEGPYIVPCDPENSKISCNLQVADGENPQEFCGAKMPLVKDSAPTTTELQAIKDWIACGAPDN